MPQSKMSAEAWERVNGSEMLLDEIEVLRECRRGLDALCRELDVAGGCREDARRACEARLHETIETFLMFATEHFIEEETLMKAQGYSLDAHPEYRAHVEDHARISEEELRIVTACDSMPMEALLRDVRALLDHVLLQHFPRHDTMIVTQPQRLRSVAGI
jgi:hemerythrin